MFEFSDGLQFINIDTEYIKALSDVCSEVSYKDVGYDRKPYIGILVQSGGRKYAIPLTSAKKKHKEWKYISADRLLVYEKIERKSIRESDIIKETDQSIKDEDYVNRILSAIDVKKMIPIRDDVMRSVELNVSDSDSSAEAKYKRLMNKEYACCVKLKEDILQKAEKVYEKQIKTGKVAKFCCDFLLLEKASDEYSVNVVSSK